MTTSAESKTSETSLTQDVINLGRHYLGGRRGLILLAVAALGAGAALNWGWLVAAGIAPILLSLAPCAIMCAVGLCAMKGGGKSCATAAPSTGENAKAQSSSAAVAADRAPESIAVASAGAAAALRGGCVDDRSDGGDANAPSSSTALGTGSAHERLAVAAGGRSAAPADRQVDDTERWLDELTQTGTMKERK